MIKERQERSLGAKERIKPIVIEKDLFIKPGDPLFGVLKEDQVGVDPITGRLRIAETVLEEMRKYIRGVEGKEKLVKEDMIKISLEELKNDPLGQKSMLRLEELPLFSTDMNKGKGVVFGYDHKEVGTKLMIDGFQADRSFYEKPAAKRYQSEGDYDSIVSFSAPAQDCSTVYRANPFAAGSSGTVLRSVKPRRRPFRGKRRKFIKPSSTSDERVIETVSDTLGEIHYKRKATDEAEITSKVARRKEVVPNEGPSSQ